MTISVGILFVMMHLNQKGTHILVSSFVTFINSILMLIDYIGNPV